MLETTLSIAFRKPLKMKFTAVDPSAIKAAPYLLAADERTIVLALPKTFWRGKFFFKLSV